DSESMNLLDESAKPDQNQRSDCHRYPSSPRSAALLRLNRGEDSKHDQSCVTESGHPHTEPHDVTAYFVTQNWHRQTEGRWERPHVICPDNTKDTQTKRPPVDSEDGAHTAGRIPEPPFFQHESWQPTQQPGQQNDNRPQEHEKQFLLPPGCEHFDGDQDRGQ